jgi:hypothetical protein
MTWPEVANDALEVVMWIAVFIFIAYSWKVNK